MQIPEEHFVYITTNKRHTLFYTGTTNNLKKRIWQHKHKLIDGFTKKYNLDKLVYYEFYLTQQEAVKGEKQIKNWSKQKKLNLIKLINPELKNLSIDWFGFKK
jgi:putative endonuclease